jgi:hypothetical protein
MVQAPVITVIVIQQVQQQVMLLTLTTLVVLTVDQQVVAVVTMDLLGITVTQLVVALYHNYHHITAFTLFKRQHNNGIHIYIR